MSTGAMSAAKCGEEGSRVRRVFVLLRLAPRMCDVAVDDRVAPSAVEVEPASLSEPAADPECIGRRRPFRVDVPALLHERAAELRAVWRAPTCDSLQPPTVTFALVPAAERPG